MKLLNFDDKDYWPKDDRWMEERTSVEISIEDMPLHHFLDAAETSGPGDGPDDPASKP